MTFFTILLETLFEIEMFIVIRYNQFVVYILQMEELKLDDL